MQKLIAKSLPVLLAGFFVLSTKHPVRAQGIEFVHDLDSAIALAKSENKPVFIDFYTSWCAPCKVMTREVFPQEKVGTYFNQRFINCKIQCDDNGKGVKAGDQYQVNAYPTLMFIDKEGKLIHSMAGSLSGEDLIEFASVALDPKRNLASLINEWEGGRRDTAFVRQYISTLKSSYRTGLASKSFEEYLGSLNSPQNSSAFIFDLLKLIGYGPGTETFQFLEDNRKQFQKTAGKKQVADYLQRGYESRLRNMALERGGKARQAYETYKDGFASRKYEFKDQVLQYAGVFESFDTAGKIDLAEYQRRGTDFLKKYGKSFNGYTLSLASLLGNCSTPKNQGIASIAWMEELIARDPKFSYYNTYFYVTWRNGQWDKALAIGRQMREMAIRDNQPTKEIDAMITQVEGYKEKDSKSKTSSAN